VPLTLTAGHLSSVRLLLGELTMNNAAALYFKDEFGSTESAAAIALHLWLDDLFARGFGGYFSDKANAKMRMRGRIIVQTVLLLFSRCALVLVFANTVLWAEPLLS
jgi:NNP family nitrate/nitrite transporter-like MFS transporter